LYFAPHQSRHSPTEFGNEKIIATFIIRQAELGLQAFPTRRWEREKNTVSFTIFEHVVWDVGFGAVDKLRDYIAVTIQL
jgi:hypothetical protein